MEIAFFLPSKYQPVGDRRAAWESGSIQVLKQSGKEACAQCWLYQTWLELRHAGMGVSLVSQMPERGVVITLAGFLGRKHRPRAGRYVAAVVADGLPHPFGQVQIVQNPLHASQLGQDAVYMPLWPHPNLVPRDPGRGNRFAEVGFFGDNTNLAPEIADPAWQDRLFDETGVRFRAIDAAGWHDYSGVDGAVAIRSFDGARHRSKPATKLYNAWSAGVPFVGGTDSAYAGDGRAGLDHLVAGSPEELKAHLIRLRQQEALRRALVEAGTQSVQRFTREAVRERWRVLLENELAGRAARWFSLGWSGRLLVSWAATFRLWRDRVGPAKSGGA